MLSGKEIFSKLWKMFSSIESSHRLRSIALLNTELQCDIIRVILTHRDIGVF
jgi:hypothetical protein